MGYVSTDEVYATAGISSSVIPEANVEIFIAGAEGEVDRLTNTTYWAKEDNGTATSAGADTLVDSTKSWTANEYQDDYVWVYSGTGEGQMRQIVSHTTDTLTVDRAWTTALDNTSKYRVIHSGQEAYNDELRDGDNTSVLFTYKYPLRILESVTINDTSITLGKVFTYPEQGKIKLGREAEETRWSVKEAQSNEINYWWGVYPIPQNVVRYVAICASLKTLMAQAGGTYNVPSTYSLPEGSVTIGQAYINIRGAWDMLEKEKTALEAMLVKYPSFADDSAQAVSTQPGHYAQNTWY